MIGVLDLSGNGVHRAVPGALAAALAEVRIDDELPKSGTDLGAAFLIHDMLDVKVLILFVASKALYPLSLQKIYELCFQDDCLSYFDVSVAVPQMVESGHLEKTGEDEYVITDKGREQEEVTSDAIAYPVMQRALAAVERFNREIKRQSMVRTEVIPREGGDFSVVLGLDDEKSNLMTIELMAPTQTQGRALARAFNKRAEKIFQLVMTELLDEVEGRDHEKI